MSKINLFTEKIKDTAKKSQKFRVNISSACGNGLKNILMLPQSIFDTVNLSIIIV